MKLNQSLNLNTDDADVLREALSKVPPGIGAKFRIHHHNGDRPWDSNYNTISFEWTEEV